MAVPSPPEPQPSAPPEPQPGPPPEPQPGAPPEPQPGAPSGAPPGAPPAAGSCAPPPPGTVERWAWDYVVSTDLSHKLAPPPVPSTWESSAAPPPPRRLERPGRPPELHVVSRAPKSPGPEALRDPTRRAQLVHAFLHHELQAAELMAWALLAFPETPRAFRGGLVQIARDEIRHMHLYASHLAALGHRFGDFPVRDWFWSRVPSAAHPAQFVAVMGMGLEGGNLDHTARFAERFRAIGDAQGAEIAEQVCAEEIPHVRFGIRWFRRFTDPGASIAPGTAAPGASTAPGTTVAEEMAGAPGTAAGPRTANTPDFEAWVDYLPPPLSPLVMRGHPLNRRDRSRAGLPDPFLDALAAWSERAPGS